MDYAYEDVKKWFNDNVITSFYDFAQDDNMKTELDKILKEGKIGNNGLGAHFSRTDNPRIEAQRRISMAYLLVNDRDTYEYLKENHINIFHGTNANALVGIAKYGLRSAKEILEANEKILSGEVLGMLENANDDLKKASIRDFISVTDVLDIAWNYMQIDPKSFSAIICTSDEKMVEDNIKTCLVSSDVSEIGIRDELPLGTVKCVLVPKDKADYVKVLFSDTNIQVLGLSNIDTRYFWFDDFMGCQFNAKEYEKYKANRLEEKEEISKITEEDLKENASSRTRSKIQEMYNWIVTLKERVINKNDSKRL